MSLKVFKSIWETKFVCSGQGRRKEGTEENIPSKFHLQASLHFSSYMSQHVTKDATIYKFHVSCSNKNYVLFHDTKNRHTYPPRFLFNWSVEVPLKSAQKSLKRFKWVLLMRLPEKNSSLCTHASSCRKQGRQVGTARRGVAKELNALQLLEEGIWADEGVVRGINYPYSNQHPNKGSVSSSALGLL